MPRKSTPDVLTLSGPQPELALALLALQDGPPDSLQVRAKPRDVSKAAELIEAGRRVTASWKRAGVTLHTGPTCRLERTSAPTVEGTLMLLRHLPFELAVGAPRFAPWPPKGEPYQGPVLGRGHAHLGWMVAFRGAGHRRLPAGWLAAVPAEHHAESDLSMLVFHAPGARPVPALNAAREGHSWFGRRLGGLISRADLPTRREDAHQLDVRTWLQAFQGRDPKRTELRAAAAVRAFGLGDREGPIHRASFCFYEPERAERLQPLLQRWGIETHTIADGRMVKLEPPVA